MLNIEEIKELREELETSKNPLFFYDDDADGLCSFLLLYKMHREGHGFLVKSTPKIDVRFLRRVDENNPDKIFILDLPLVEQDFIDGVKRKILWIDHHAPLNNSLDLSTVRYYNPRIEDPKAYLPVTRMAYQISQNPEDLWIAVIGCLGDWYLPDFIDEFIEKYPHLLPEKKDLDDAVYHQPIGKLVQIFSFLLKGQTSEVSRCIRILTRIREPAEILEQSSSQGRYLYKRYELIAREYLKLLAEAKKAVPKSNFMAWAYTAEKYSFTSELSNELATLYPNKTIVICRKKSGEMKCSLRSRKNVSGSLEKALVGINGYGGGHEQACGAVIKEEDWEQFLKNLKRELKESIGSSKN